MITVFGDSILDVYQFVKHVKKSPESIGDVYELLPKRLQYKLGGAAAVAAICKHLGNSPLLLTRCGNDDVGGMLRSLLTRYDINTHLLEINKGTTSKLRYVTEANRLTADRFDKNFYQYFDWGMFTDWDTTHYKNHTLVISDYRGGLCNNVKPLMESGAKCIIVDPAIDRNWLDYKGAKIIKCNREEFLNQIKQYNKVLQTMLTINAAQYLAKDLNAYLVITNGPRDIYIYTPNAPSIEIGIDRLDAKDITGCGDTITAAMACYLDKVTINIESIVAAVKYAIPFAAKQTQSIGVNYESLL